MSIYKKDINFIERYQEDPQKRTARRKQLFFIAPLAFLLVVLVAIYVSFLLAGMVKKSQLAAADAYLLASEEKHDQVITLRDQRDRLALQAGFLTQIKKADETYPLLNAALFQKINACTDANFTIQSYRYDGTMLQLGANAASEEYMPDAVQKLRATGLFETIEYTGYTSDTDGTYTCIIGCVLRPANQDV